jgi:hypothetical protein
MLETADCEAAAQEKEQRAALAFADVEFTGRDIGLVLEQQDGGLVVVGVRAGGAAAASLRVRAGFEVVSVSSKGQTRPVNTKAQLDAEMETCGGKFTVKFQLPPPPMPPPGWARKAARRSKQVRHTESQLAFLDQCFDSELTGGARMRDGKVYSMMMEMPEFKVVNKQTGRPMYLRQSQIASYFGRRAAERKREHIKKAVGGGGEYADDQLGDADGAPTKATADDYTEVSYRELQAQCKQRGLTATGKRGELVERLVGAVNGAS